MSFYFISRKKKKEKKGRVDRNVKTFIVRLVAKGFTKKIGDQL